MTSSNEAELSPNSQSGKPKDRNERGETALHICAKKGDFEGAKKLLEQGTDPNVADFAGWTPLHEASNHGHYPLAQLLVKHGANVNATGLEDVTPLHDAASFGNQKLVKLLIDKGADPFFKSKKGKTPQDMAHPSLFTFFGNLVNEMANKRDTQQQQQQSQGQKKPTTTENKRSNEADDGAVGPSTATPSDVYEFVSTPKHSSCSSGSGDENPSKNSDKSSDDKSGTDSDTPTTNTQQQKRPLVDQQDPANDDSSAADEEAKKKKRKDSEAKEGNKSVTGTNRVTSRVGQKPPGPASKTMGLVNKNSASGTVDGKSPSETAAKQPESDNENDDSKEGPKVPPLKIVIPQQGGSDVPETQSITQKTSTKQAPSRNHPYVVASSNSNDGTGSDKDGAVGRGQSPSADSNKSDDAGKPIGKSKEPRILRSSRKDAKDDRGSNNSSPQLPASSTPSPAGQNAEASAGNESENQQSNQNVASSSSSSSSSNSAATTVTSSIQSSSQTNQQQPQPNPVELHPRKRKIKASSREPASVTSTADVKDSNSKDGAEKTEPVHPHDQPFTNCYQMYIDLRKQIEQRHRNLHFVEPRPLKGCEDYLMNTRTYALQGKSSVEPNIIIPPLLPMPMKETFIEQEKERHRLKLRHIVEREKLVLSKEQEILRVHCKAAQMIASQSTPFSVCSILKDEEVYNIITPELEEKYRNKNRERSHGRVFYQALKELDDKYDKIKEAMIIRHTNEAESLAAVQKMDWGWKMKEFSLCEYKANPEIEELFVPMIDVSDENTTPSIKD